MASIIFKKIDGTELTVQCPIHITKSDISTYYAEDICAIIDNNNEITALGSDVGETVDDNLLFSSNDLPALKYVKFNGVTELYPYIFYNSGNLISAELSSVSAFVQGTYGGAIYEGGQFASNDNLKYINLASITEFSKQNLGTALFNTDPFDICLSLLYMILSSDAGHTTLLTSDVISFTWFPANITLVVNNILEWELYSLEKYGKLFTDKFEITLFSLSYVDNTLSFECPRISKTYLGDCIDEFYEKFDKYPCEFTLNDSNSYMTFLDDAFHTTKASSITTVAYNCRHDLYKSYYSETNSYLDGSCVSATYISIYFENSNVIPQEFLPYEYTGGCDLAIYYNEDVFGPEDRTFYPINPDDPTYYRDHNDAITTLDLGNITRIGNFPNNDYCGSIASYENLKDVYGPEVTAIGSEGLSGGFSNLTGIWFDNLLSCLDYSMCFSGGGRETDLLDLVFPSLKYIGNNAFENNCLISSLSCPELLEIANSSFYCAGKLETVSAYKLTAIGDDAFKDPGFWRFRSIAAPLLRYIGSHAFDGCHNLSNVFSPEITTMNCYMTQYIGEGAFNGCQNLTSINGRFVEYIGVSAFNNCTNLTQLNFPLLSTCVLSEENHNSNLTNLHDCWNPIGGAIDSEDAPNVDIRNTVLQGLQNYTDNGLYFTGLPYNIDNVQLLGKNCPLSSIQFKYNSGIANNYNQMNNKNCTFIGNDWHHCNPTWGGQTVNEIYYRQYDDTDLLLTKGVDYHPWMHLCLDPAAAKYLSAIFLTSYMKDEYDYYIASNNFLHAESIHDYVPKNYGSIYDAK